MERWSLDHSPSLSLARGSVAQPIRQRGAPLERPRESAPAGGGSRRARTAALLFVLVVTGVLWAPRLSGPIDLHYDGSVYYVLGTALSEGRGYRLLNEPGEIEALQYPPLLALFVAAHQRLLGSTDPTVVAPALRLSYALLSLAYTAAVFLLAARFLPMPWALLATLLCALSYGTLYLSDLLYPELPFALLTMLFFLAHGSADPRWRKAAGPLAIGAYLVRAAGLALLAAWVVEALLARDWKKALARAAPCALAVLLWQAHGARVEHSDAYRQPAYAYQREPYLYNNVSYGKNLLLVDPFAPERGTVDLGGFGARLVSNVSELPLFVGELLSGTRLEWSGVAFVLARHTGVTLPFGRIVLVPLVLLGLAALAGVAFLARRERSLIPLYVLASLALIATTPWVNQFWRYLAPLCPLLAIGLACLLGSAARAVDRRWARSGTLATACVAALLLLERARMDREMLVHGRSTTVVAGRAGNVLDGRGFYLEPGWAGLDEALAWLRKSARPDEVVASSSPHFVYLNTGCKSVMPPLEPDPAAAQALLDGVPASYLILDELEFCTVPKRYARPVVEARPDLWERVFTATNGSGVEVWKRRSRT